MSLHAEQPRHRHSLKFRAQISLLAVLSFLAALLPSRSAAQAIATNTTLTLSSHAVAQGMVVTASVLVTDAAGPVLGGQVDFFDGTQLAATAQVVRTAASGNAVGTATLRRLFGAGLHPLHAAYRATAADAASTSAVQLLTVTGSNPAATPLPAYANTRDVANGPVYGMITDVVTADFNGDGILDLAATEFDYPTLVAVSLGDSAHPGQFLAPLFIPVIADPINNLQAIDYDADGLVDLIVAIANSSETFLVRNNPAKPGTFLSPIRTNFPPISAFTDFTRDGLPDLIGSSSYSGTDGSLTLYANDTANGGTFKAVSTTPMGIRTLYAIQAADVNGDGFPDVILNGNDALSNTYTVVILADPATPGKFSAPVLYLDSSFVTCIVDLNGDGLPDMVSSVYTGVIVRLNDPAHPGTFLQPTFFPANGAFHLAYGDVDGDGKVDIVAGSGGTSPATQNSFQILHGNGDGTFAPPVSVMTGPIPTVSWESNSVTIADFDGDGLGDVVMSARQNALQIFLHQTTAVPLIRTATEITASLGYILYSNQTQTLTATETTTSGVLAGTIDFYDSFGGGVLSPIGSAPIINGAATLVIPNPRPGFHSNEAVFHGDALYAPSESSGVGTFVRVAGAPSVTSLTATPNPSTLGQAVTLRAVVSDPSFYSISATGSIQFFEGNTSLGTVALASNTASLIVPNFTVGSHAVTAVYSGDQGYATSTSAAVTIVVLGAASQVALTASPNPAAYGSTVALSATVASTTTPLVGSVAFFDGATSLGNVPLSSGTAALSVSSLSPGTHSLTAVYSGDAAHNAATSNTVTEIINGAPSTVAISATPSPAYAFTPVVLNAQIASPAAPGGTQFSGVVTFYANGASLGSATASASGAASLSTAALGAGTYSLTASFAGNPTFAAGASAATTEQVLPDMTVATLTATPNPARRQQSVSYSVAVTAAHSTPSPGGAIALFDGTTVVGGGTLDARGIFVGTVGSLPPGTHPLTAVYAGSGNWSGSSSAAFPLVVLEEDFGVTPSVSSLSVVTEHHAPMNIAVASLGGLEDTVSFTCLDLPEHATCTFGSKQMRLDAAATVTDSLMLDTDDVLYFANTGGNRTPGRVSVCLIFGAWTLLGLFAGPRRRKMQSLLAAILMCGAATVLSGCSGKYPGHTAPGTYVIHIEVHAQQTGIVHNVPVKLTVTP